MAEGNFREDLYYRLNVIPIFIPPLRQRPEDLAKLCRFLLRKLNQDYGRAVKGVDDEVMGRFLAYKWPGNVRELENVLGRAIINMGFQEQIIYSEHVPPLGWGGHLNQAVDMSYTRGNEGQTLSEAVARAEIEAIKRALERHSYNKTRAAKSLGISIRALYNKIHKYGLAPKTS